MVRRFREFSPESTLFSEEEIYFYGSLSCDSEIVGFEISATADELVPMQVIPNVMYRQGSVFPAFLVREVEDVNSVYPLGEELFGDISLHSGSGSTMAFLFHSIDAQHPLHELLRASSERAVKRNGG